MGAVSAQCIMGGPGPGPGPGAGRRAEEGRRGVNSSSSLFFTSRPLLTATSSSLTLLIAPSRFSMRVASNKQAYICRDCGYIYSDRTPFEKKPDNYFCPVCGAPKRRFRAYDPPVTKDANSADVRKARKAQLKRDETLGNALPYVLLVGILALAALYLYLNNTY